MILSVFPGPVGAELPFPPALLGGIYLVMAIVYLFRFSNYLGDALRTGSDQELELAFSNLKAHYKFISIVVIVTIALYLLAIVVGIVAGIFMG